MPSFNNGTDQAPWRAMARSMDHRLSLQGFFGGIASRFRQRRQAYSLRRTRNSFWLILIAIWHTIAFWLSACIYVTLAANLLLAWYIDWFRSIRTADWASLDEFPKLAYFAIFLRSWLMTWAVAELARFTFLLVKDTWRLDMFLAYRKAACGLLDIRLEGVSHVGSWPDDILSSRLRWVDMALQCWIYLSFDVLPLVVGLVYVSQGEGVGKSMMAGCVALSAAGCIHVLMFFLFWNIIDVRLTAIGFHQATFRDGDPEVRPRQYEGEHLEDFQWGRSFGDRHLHNLEDARNISFAEGISLCSSSEMLDRWLTLEDEAAGVDAYGRPAAPKGSADSGSEAVGKISSAELAVTHAFSGTSHRATASSSMAVPPRSPPTLQLPVPAGSETAGSDSRSTSGDRLSPREGRTPDATAYHRRISWLASSRPTSARQTVCARKGTMWRGVRHEGSLPAVDDKMNLCVALCGCCDGMQGEFLLHFCWFAMIVAGAQYQNLGLTLGGVAVCVIVWARYCLPKRAQVRSWSCRIGWGGDSWRLWALQAWGETHCSLRYEHQLLANANFAVVMLSQGILFAVLTYWAGTAICGATVLCTCIRQLMVKSERPWGWLVGLIEGVIIGLGTVVANFSAGSAHWGSVCIVVVILRQFGMPRFNPHGFQVARVTALFLNVLLVLVVSVVVLTTADNSGANDWSSMCDPKAEGCTYETVPFKPTTNEHGILCQGRFELHGQKALSISDFALLSSLAYESHASMDTALKHYFPGWRVDRYHFASPDRDKDWTTFFEYSDPDNTTTVFSVRGTDSKLDILNDINIWTPAAIMQVFSLVGPHLPRYLASGVALLSTVLYTNFQKRYFDGLLSRVQSCVKANPSRRFYITGHSLGGGLAKLVAAKSRIQAVTFMAPGLQTTYYIIYGEMNSQAVRNNALTVTPENDVVSRVDTQVGTVIPVDCSGGPAQCHKINPLVCQIFKRCGSGRPEGPPVMLPARDVTGKVLCPTPS